MVGRKKNSHQNQAAYKHREENKPFKVSVLHKCTRAPTKPQPVVTRDMLTAGATSQR